jgi:lipopolysaccharide transport system ATP-binding protein
MPIGIKAENISKAYRIGEISTGTLQSDFKRWYATLIKRV